MKFSAPTGVYDIIPENPNEKWKEAHLWQLLEHIVRKTATQFGYREIRTPIFERADLFLRSVGDESDIVSKEMYLFEDKGGRQMALRPEGTAAAMRAFIENGMESFGHYQKLYYIAPMFRYDRPQAGRFRQHMQFGVEALGAKSPEQDVEVIALLHTVLARLGVGKLEVQINTIGDDSSRKLYRESLVEYLTPHKDKLSKDSQRRLETNPLRILDSKAEQDRELIKEAPSILDFLSEESYHHFERVKKLLSAINIPYVVNPQLVRGLDYYNELVFEVTAKELGAQCSIGGGGRYDGLMKTLGGPDLPAVGFGAGMERILQALVAQGRNIPEAESPTLYIIPMGDEAKSRAFSICNNLRHQNIQVSMDMSGRKLTKAMDYANKIKAKYVIVLGEKELESQQLTIKEMKTGKEHSLNIEGLGGILHLIERSEPFMELWSEMDQPFENSQHASFFMEQVHQTVQETQDATQQFQERLDEMRKLLQDDDTP